MGLERGLEKSWIGLCKFLRGIDRGCIGLGTLGSRSDILEGLEKAKQGSMELIKGTRRRKSLEGYIGAGED